jgi:hypothetical protein
MRGERGRDYKLCLAVEYFSIDGSPECALNKAFALLVIKFCVGSDPSLSLHAFSTATETCTIVVLYLGKKKILN